MGSSKDYSNVAEWTTKDTGYHTDDMVRYKNNIFRAAYWAGKEPGVDPGWSLYDELYDQTSPNPTTTAKIIGYLPTWRKDLDFGSAVMYQNITHGIIAFLNFDENNLGELDQTSAKAVTSIVQQVVTTAHQAGTYISVAIGGAVDYGFLNLLTAVGSNASDARLDKAVQNVAQFVKDNALDGVDLDLECWWDKNGDASKDQGGRDKSKGPHPAGSALVTFAQKLKSALPGKLISATLFATSWYGNSYDPKLADYVDWLSIMSYDLTGSWNQTPVGPHTALYKIRKQDQYKDEQQGPWPLTARGPSNNSTPMDDNPIFSVEDSLWYWSNPFFVNWQGAGQKVARNKLVAGVPLYGYDFAYKKDPDPESGQTPPGYKVLRYKELVQQFSGASTAGNANIKVSGNTPRPSFVSATGTYPYAHNIYLETPDTAVAKLKFLDQLGLQGVIIWEMSNEVWDDGKSIVKALYKASGNPATRPALPVPNFAHAPVQSGDLTGKAGQTENTLNEGTNGTPGIVVFNNVLYAVYESTDKDSHKPTGRISYISCTDGKKWESPEKTDTKDGYGTTGAPALIVLGDTLYAFHEGFQQNRQLWFATAKSVNGDLQWQGDNDSKFGTTGAPALAIYKGEDGKDQIYCVHLGDDGQSLWWARYNGTKWTQSDTRLGNQAAATRPSLCVWDDKLYCVYQGAGNGEFWYVYYNGKEWTPGNKTAYATYGAPGLAAYNNKLYAFHEGYLGAAGGVTAGANIGGTIGAGVGTVAGSVGGPGGLATGGVAGTLAGEGVGATIGAIAGAANPRSYKLWYTGCEKAKADFTEPNDTDTGFGVTDPPALVVANNTFYCVHGGHDGNGEIWWFYIGTNGELSGDEQLNGLTGSPPALIEFDGQLYSVYQRGGGDDKIAWTTLPFNSHADHPDNPDKKWTEIRGANSYGYDMIDRQAAGDGAVSTSKTINVQAGTPVVYAALTNTEDDIDFPNGATLTITAPDGSTFSSARDDDTAVVVLSGQTLQALVLLAPKAGDYKVELSVPAKTPFHFEFEAAPTKDVATTILNAFATAGQSLARRDVNDPAALNQQLSVLAAGAIAQLARLLIIYAKKKGNQPAVSWSHTILAATSVIVGIYVSSTILGRSRAVPTAQNQRLTRILLENLEENDYTQAAALTGTFQILRPSSREVETYTDFQRFRRATRRGQRRPGMQNIDTNAVHPEDIAVQVQFDGWASPSPWFRINGEDAYINAVNPDPPGTMTNTVTFNETGWREINNVTYRTAGVINRNSIRAAFQDAANLGNNPTRPTPGAPRRGNPQTGTVEIVAFVLAEAIRFEVVGNAIDRLYASDAAGDETGFQWETFRPLLNNWQRIYDQVYDGQRTFAIPMQVTRDFVNRTGDFAGFNIGNWDQNVLNAITAIIDRLLRYYPG